LSPAFQLLYALKRSNYQLEDNDIAIIISLIVLMFCGLTGLRTGLGKEKKI
jgi:hypothetical protein